MVHAGSWLGLPDFGVTEAIGNIFGSPRTSQGGSDLNLSSQQYSSPSYNGPISSPGVNYSSGGSVLGSSTLSGLSGGGSSGSSSSSPVQDPYAGVITSTGDEAAAELRALQTEYDRNRANLEGQLSQLGTDRSQGLSSLQSAVDEYGNVIGTQKTSAENARAKQVQSAGSAARQTQAKSRNVLRALGILSSSAAGDILSRPMTEFAGQRADINLQTQQRIQQLDDALAQKTSEHTNLVAQLESQYAQLVGQIQSDLRFSDRERADAIAQANAAAQSRLSEIKMAQANWQNQINAAKNGLLTSQASLSNFTNPTADINAITGTGLNTTQQYNPQRYQASIVTPDKEKLSGIYG